MLLAALSVSHQARASSVACWAALALAAGVAPVALAQSSPPMFQPTRAELRYEVAYPGGPWGSSVTVRPGTRVEWRAVIHWTDPSTDGGPAGTVNALGQIYYQPLIGNADIEGSEAQRDRLDFWRNGGRSCGSPAGVPIPIVGILDVFEGESSSPNRRGYGRVVFGYTCRGANTSTSTQNALTSFTHAGPSPNGAVTNYIRIAGQNNPTPYAATVPTPNATLLNQILNGVVSDNASPSSSWHAPGISNLVIFRHALLLSEDYVPGVTRQLTITSEPGSARRASSGSNDTRFMTWQGTHASTPPGGLSTGFAIVPATITVDPAAPLNCADLDFNNDGIAPDPTDIEALLSVYSGGPCLPANAACDPLDFNYDGLWGDPTDLESFLSVYQGGPCL